MIHASLPRLDASNNSDTSPATSEYNCIAWAAGDDTRWWWPVSLGGYYWPSEAPRETTVDAFRAAFATLGYEECESSAQEPDFDRIALYARDGQVTHAARQLDDGTWTSKLGKEIDIAHDTAELVGGGTYGEPVLFMRRDKSLPPRPPGKPPGRNDPCWCGGGDKYKRCHGRIAGS